MAIKSVLTVGGAMIDTIAVIDSDDVERMTLNNADKKYLLLESGKKSEAKSIATHPGGGAVNASVSFSRLGFDVAALVKIGNDERGDAIAAALQKEHVALDYVSRTSALATGASVMISSHDRNPAIFTYRGANTLLAESDISPASVDRHIVYITALSDGSADVFPLIVTMAHERGAFITANPGIRQLAAKGAEFQAVLPKVRLLAMNTLEASALIPRLNPKRHQALMTPVDGATPPLMRRGLSYSGFDLGFRQFIEAVLELGVEYIVVTDGSSGAYAADASQIVYCPSPTVEVVGTAGAGDAFTSTITAQIANGVPLPDAMQLATTNAVSVVMYADTQSGLLTHADLAAERQKRADQMPIRSWPLH